MKILIIIKEVKMKGSIIKKILLSLTAVVFMLGIYPSTVSAAEQSYEIRYVHSAAPAGANVPSKSYTIAATGNNYIRLSCTRFIQQVPNMGYMSQSVSGYSIASRPISSTGIYNVYFSGTNVPRAGIPITVTLSLNGYGDTNPMTVEGKLLY